MGGRVMLDNSEIIAQFVPEVDDGDSFVYTEMLDRGRRKGNNGHRLVKTFYHRSREEFRSQLPVIKRLCDMSLVRACTRIAPRSFRRVAGTFLRLVTETYITENFAGMKSLYNRACGTTSPNEKLWLFDVDVIDDAALALEGNLKTWHIGDGRYAWVATIPSKKGMHLITRPFRLDDKSIPKDIALHKDNPTNLYIPDGAD